MRDPSAPNGRRPTAFACVYCGTVLNVAKSKADKAHAELCFLSPEPESEVA